MKRLICICVTILFGVCQLTAEPITQQQAFQKAQAFLEGKYVNLAKQRHRLKSTVHSSEPQSYYVFNAEDNKGFVIVSGDDRTREILAYADYGNFDIEEIPSNVQWWLDYYERVITNLDKVPQQSPLRGRRKEPEREIVAPFITTTWGQGAPYNAQCPIVDDEHCVTGCVATAMAQVMNYMRCPEGQTSAINGYTTEKLNLPVDGLAPTSFDWDNMTDDDIARLMRYCGQGVKMDYGLDESDASEIEVPYAMKNFFGFDKEMCFAYPSEGWEEILYAEIAEGRPVIYGASSDLGRHAFICNGYQDGKFYINWGWDGNFDGYYELSLLDVTEGVSYNNDHCAIVHIKKSTEAPIDEGDGRVFTAQSPEGITLTFSVVSEYAKTCRVGDSEDNGMSAIDESVTGTLTVPSEIEGYRVVSIGESAFFRNNLSEIILPESITRINGTAFRYSFELSSITIPKSVTYISNGALFSECPKLREIIVDKDNPIYDSRDNCNAIIHTASNMLIAGCGGTIIPRTCTAIASTSLMDCYGMESLFINKDLTYINPITPIWGCPDLESIVVEEGNPYYASPNNCNAIIDMQNEALILGCSQTVIPSNVKIISDAAFFNNKKLKSIVIPEGVEALFSQTFTGCENLEEVTLPSTLTYMAGNDFSQCNLKSIFIPDGVERLMGSFWNNFNLTNITGGKNLVESGHGTFAGCACETFTIGDKVETIGDAFERCSNLKSIYIPKGVQSIGREAFKSCYSLESMEVEKENPVYDSRNNCNAIIETATNKMVAGCMNTTFPEGVKSIADYCFWECYHLKEVNFPNSLEEIGNYAFYLCENLQAVTLPNNLKELGDGAFNNCNNLRYVFVNWPEPIPLYSGSTFSNSANAILYVPDGCKAAYLAAEFWRDFKEIRERSEMLIPGDTNGDGKVSITDAVYIVNYVLHQPAADFREAAADLNGDGKITITDAVQIINIILKQ